jgi:hypothetical protein
MNEDSDTYLRAYSSVRKDSAGRNRDTAFESVRITTTRMKLQRIVMRALQQDAYLDVCVFSCGVRYTDAESIKSAIASVVHRTPATDIDRAKQTADLCLLKRLSFEYEREVRLLVMFPRSGPTEPLLRLKVDPASFIDEVVFDPRLAKAERLERAQILDGTQLGGRVVDREQYQGVVLEVGLGRNEANVD